MYNLKFLKTNIMITKMTENNYDFLLQGLGVLVEGVEGLLHPRVHLRYGLVHYIQPGQKLLTRSNLKGLVTDFTTEPFPDQA